MSVINRMLRQLDARAASPTALARETGQAAAAYPLAGGAASSAPPTTQAVASLWRLPVIVLLGGAVIGAAAFADLSPWQTQPAVVLPPAALDAPVVVLASEVTAPEAAPPPETVSAPAERAPAPLARPTAAPAAPTAPAASSAPAPAPATAPASATAQPLPPATPTSLSVAWPQPGPTLPRIDKRALPGTAAERAALAHRDAMDLARLGQNQAALQRALQAVAQDPAHAAARQLAAVLQHEAGASDSALALLREGAGLPAAPAALTLLLARLLATQGLDAEALSWLDRQGLHSGEAEGLRAGLLAQRGQYALALPAYESAVQQQPGNPMWWFGLAVALESEGQGARARQAFAQARQLRLPREDLDAYAEQRLRALP